jgi:DNA-binding NarL/FixJ family response regulator
MSIKILIVDDHAVVRQGLRMFLQTNKELEIVGEAANGVEGLERVEALQPDVVLMDLLMPVMDGISAIHAIHERFPETQLIALTSVLENASVSGAIKAGATGYVLKNTDAEELVRAIKAAHAGQVYLSAQAATQLMHDMQNPDPVERLTERELDVLKLLAQGKANKEIALALVIAETTVKTHVSNIMMKLNAVSRTQAALLGVKAGLVPTTIFEPAE